MEARIGPNWPPAGHASAAGPSCELGRAPNDSGSPADEYIKLDTKLGGFWFSDHRDAPAAPADGSRGLQRAIEDAPPDFSRERPKLVLWALQDHPLRIVHALCGAEEHNASAGG